MASGRYTLRVRCQIRLLNLLFNDYFKHEYHNDIKTVYFGLLVVDPQCELMWYLSVLQPEAFSFVVSPLQTEVWVLGV